MIQAIGVHFLALPSGMDSNDCESHLLQYGRFLVKQICSHPLSVLADFGHASFLTYSGLHFGATDLIGT